jgi:transposase
MPSKKDIAVVRAIGIDTGKNTLHMIGLDEKGTIVLREKLSRGRVAARLVNVPPCLIGIEATVIRRRHTSSSRTMASKRWCRIPSCWRSTRRTTSSGSTRAANRAGSRPVP